MRKPIPLFAKDIMTTTVVTLTGDQTLEHLEQAMRLLRFRHMPVVDGDRIIGVVSLRDALRVSASTLLPRFSEQNAFLGEHFHVADVMTRDVYTVTPETPLAEVAALLLERKIGCAPVVEPPNRLVGIITETDFVKLAVELQRRLLDE